MDVFYKVSLTGLIANMVLVPLASLLLGLSFAYYLFTLCHIGVLLYYPTVWCLEVFKWLVEFFASWSFSSLSVTAWSTWLIAAYYIGLFGLLHLTMKKWRRILFVIIPLLISVLLIGHFVQRSHTRVYLLNEWYKNVAIVKIKQGPVFIIGNGLDPEKVKNALKRIGYRSADAVLVTETKTSKFKYDDLAPLIVYPFESYWPGQEIKQFGRVRVSMQWGLHDTKEGKIWYNTGYSGGKQDDVSYCFSLGEDPAFCVGDGLVLGPNVKAKSVLNQTLEVKL